MVKVIDRMHINRSYLGMLRGSVAVVKNLRGSWNYKVGNLWITPSSLTAQVPRVVVGGGGDWAQVPSLGVWGGRRETG